MNGSSLFSQLEAEGTPATGSCRARLWKAVPSATALLQAADARGAAAASRAIKGALYQEREWGWGA